MLTIAFHSTLTISETVTIKGPPIGNGIWAVLVVILDRLILDHDLRSLWVIFDL